MTEPVKSQEYRAVIDLLVDVCHNGQGQIGASGLNQLKCRVEALKLDAGIGGCKAPVSFDIVGVAVKEPGRNLALETAPVRDTPIETLIGQDSKLGLGHVEPAAVLGRVVPFEPLDDAASLGRLEGFIK